MLADSDCCLPDDVAAILARIAARQPRVHCITNTVAQNLTANILLAIGAEPTMALHPGEVVAMAAQADALLINLGTFDQRRETAIAALVEAGATLSAPVVIDPVMADKSPLRQALAIRLVALPRVILKGNRAEMAALEPFLPMSLTRVTTGAIDLVDGPSGTRHISAGHPMMARVTGTGCAAGAIIAAFAAVEDDPVVAAAAALTCFGMAGGEAARQSAGPGSFAIHLLDTLSRFADTPTGAAT
jgi:hydroxyethylthiazole kinase